MQRLGVGEPGNPSGAHLCAPRAESRVAHGLDALNGLAGVAKVWPRYYCWKCLVVFYKGMLPEETLEMPLNHIT